jgi:hypothetical protein
MHIITPSDLAVLFTLGAILLLAATTLLFCLQRPRGQMQPAGLREPNAGGMPRR